MAQYFGRLHNGMNERYSERNGSIKLFETTFAMNEFRDVPGGKNCRPGCDQKEMSIARGSRFTIPPV